MGKGNVEILFLQRVPPLWGISVTKDPPIMERKLNKGCPQGGKEIL
jgi:hypothetical protein